MLGIAHEIIPFPFLKIYPIINFSSIYEYRWSNPIRTESSNVANYGLLSANPLKGIQMNPDRGYNNYLVGSFPFWESMDGAGLSVTEFVCEIRWIKFGKVSATEGLSWGPHGMPGAGLVGVMSGGRPVRGLLGGKPLDSLMSIWRMLWMTSPAPPHRSEKSFFVSKQRALPKKRVANWVNEWQINFFALKLFLPFIWNLSMSIFSRSNSRSQNLRKTWTSSRSHCLKLEYEPD